jgi:hypothetical protein
MLKHADCVADTCGCRDNSEVERICEHNSTLSQAFMKFAWENEC